MMLYHVRRETGVRSRIEQARELLNFLASSVPAENAAYSAVLGAELKALQKADDWSVQYDLLGEINQPLYFREFLAQARLRQFQFLGEAEFHTMLPGEYSEATAGRLNQMASSREELEQYLDFLRNRERRA